MNHERNSEAMEKMPAKATWREWLGLAALTLAVFMLATDMTVLFLAMPSIAADLAPSSTEMLWILHVGEFLAVGFAITMGSLSDRIGRRRLLLTGITVYGTASLIAAFSTSAWMLIAIRALLGIAAATVMPSTMSLLRNMFADPKQFSVAIAVNLSAFSAGMALGPPMGGLLLDHFWWGAVFLINVPVALALLAAAPLLPEYRQSGAFRFDFLSVALSTLALMALVFGLQEMAASGFALAYIASVAAGILMSALFVRRQLRLDDPLLDLRMFRIPAFTYSLVVLLLIMLATGGGTDMLFAQHLQGVLGLSATQAGLLLIVPALLSMTGTLISPVLTRWMRPAYAMSSGLFIAFGGTMLIVMTVHEAGPVTLITGASLMAFGLGPALAITGEQILSSVPQEKAGSASSMSDVSSGLGFALSIAFLGSFGMVIYRGALTNAMPPEVPTETAGTAMDSLGTAIAAARQLPDPLGAELLQAVQSSFTLAVQVAYAASALGLAVVAFVVVWKLRHICNGSTEESDASEQTDGEEEKGAV